MKSPIPHEIFRTWFIPALLILPGIFHLLLYGLPYTHDVAAHLWRIARMHDSMQNLILFPRWIPEMLLGYGYPVLNYYASASYYLVQILAFFGVDLIKSFIAVHWLLMWLAAVGMYVFARDTYAAPDSDEDKHPWAAYVASVAYAYSPYLLTNIYIRSAIAELAAQALLPWIFWSFQRIWRAQNPQRYIVIAGLTLGALAFSHTISLLIVPPLLVAYNLVLAFSTSERNPRLLYAGLAVAGAMGITCFFWGPLLLERSFVAYTGFEISKQLMLPGAFLTLAQLVNTSFLYHYPFPGLVTLGLIQSGGAIIGLLVLLWQMGSRWAKDVAARNEWLFWIGVMIFCVLMMLDVSTPLWLSNDILAIIQFPWRLLAILQLSVALFTGLIVTLFHHRFVQIAAAVALMTLLIVVHLPNLDWDFRFDSRTAQYNVAVNAYYDAIRGTIVEGLRMDLANQEFRPKWAGLSMQLDPTTVEGAPALEESARKVSLAGVSSHHLQLAVESATEWPLRLTGYYFPGWEVMLDGREKLEPYPSTNLGLLTADIPAGAHTVDIFWRGTRAQIWSGYASLLALVMICLILLWWRPLRGWLVVMVPLLVLGVIGTFLQPQLAPVQRVALAESPPGLEFLGYRTPEVSKEGIKVPVYWFVTQTEPPSIQMNLQLVAEDGEVVQEVTARPVYNAYSSQQWASNTVVDEGYWLPLPPGLAAGSYHLRMTLLDEESGKAYHSWEVGPIAIAEPTDRLQPSHPLDIRYGEDVVLSGYDFGIVEPRLDRYQALSTKPEVPVVYTGQTLAYTLYWRSENAENPPYIGFMHLLDRHDIAYAQQDQSPGPLFQPPAMWTPYGLYRDSYQLPLAGSVPSGLYITDVGMYNWHDERRLDVTIPGVEGVFDHYELPQVKVVNRSVRPKGTRVGARFGDFAELARFEVHDAEGNRQSIDATGVLEVQPGTTLSLTTYYKANAPSPTSLTPTAQVRDAQNQILTQYDSEPQDGRNPTWAWVPGEVVADVISLTIPEDAAEDEYTLYLGWYDAAANFARPPLFDDQGNRLPNDEVPLLKLKIMR